MIAERAADLLANPAATPVTHDRGSSQGGRQLRTHGVAAVSVGE